jgi:hypothetical protein
VLEQLGIVAETPPAPPNYLDIMLQKFGSNFPATDTFSAYARSTLTDLDPSTDPDAALMAWMEREEAQRAISFGWRLLSLPELLFLHFVRLMDTDRCFQSKENRFCYGER